MNDSMRDLLRQGADTVERPNLDVDLLVAQAEGRVRRRRLAAVATSAVAVAVIATGVLVALGPEERDATPAPAPTQTPSIEPAPVLGETIYFTATSSGGDALTAPNPSLTGQADLYLGREGGVAQRIIESQAGESCPSVSPDGEWLAYLSGPNKEFAPVDLVVVPLDSRGEPALRDRRVLLEDAMACPQWSPDSRFLGVVAGDATYPDGELRVVRLDGTERVLVDLPPYLLPHIGWSPDSDELAYTTEDSVFTVSASGGAPELLWRGAAYPDPEPGGLPQPGAPRSLSWLGSGEIVLLELVQFTESRDDTLLHFLDADSGRDRTPADIPAEVAGGSWSPDGSRVVYLEDGTGRPWVYDRDAGTAAAVRPRLPGMPGASIYDVAWSRDGTRLVAGAAAPDSTNLGFALVSMEADGSDVVILTPWSMALYSTYVNNVS